VKPIKPGTKWRVRSLHDRGQWVYDPLSTTSPVPTVFDSRARAMRVLWRMREIYPANIYRLVRILPRVDHKAEAERLRAAIRAALSYARAGILLQTIDVLETAAGPREALTPPDPARKGE